MVGLFMGLPLPPSLPPSVYPSHFYLNVDAGVRSNTLPRPRLPAGAERGGGCGNGVGDTDLAAQDDEEGERRGVYKISLAFFARACCGSDGSYCCYR